jgi:adenine-specific DNA glycosylase
MELGSQVCKPVSPDCVACPLRSACKAYAELSTSPPVETKECAMCVPVPNEGERIPSVTVFPMKKEKKTSREEHEVVCVLEWDGGGEADRRWLFVKRPETGELFSPAYGQKICDLTVRSTRGTFRTPYNPHLRGYCASSTRRDLSFYPSQRARYTCRRNTSVFNTS